jgi:hypothetical protein
LITIAPSKIDLARVKNTLGLIKKNVDPVIYRSINKTIGTNRTLTMAKVHADLNLTKTYIRNKGFKVKGGNWMQLKAGPGRLRGQYWSKGKPIGFINFEGTKQLKNGKVSVKIKRKGERFYLEHAFIAKAKGALNVWEREPSARGGRAPTKTRKQYAGFMEKAYGRKWRLKLHRMAGPRIPGIMAKPTVLKPIELHAVVTLQKNIDSLLAYELSKL